MFFKKTFINNLLIIFYLIILIISFTNCGKKVNHKRLAQTYYKLAIVELEQDGITVSNYKKALDYTEKALTENEFPEYLALKATILFKLGQYQESEIFLKQAIDTCLDPKTRAEILNNQACLLAQMDKPEQACKIWQELEQDKDYLTPEVALYNLSKIYIKDNNLNKAKETLLKATQVAPFYLDAHYYLASVSIDLKDYKLAKKELDYVIMLEPDHQFAKDLYTKIPQEFLKI